MMTTPTTHGKMNTASLDTKLSQVLSRANQKSAHMSDVGIAAFLGVDRWSFLESGQVHPTQKRLVKTLHMRMLLIHYGVVASDIRMITGHDLFGEGYCGLLVSTGDTEVLLCPDKPALQELTELPSMGYTITHQQQCVQDFKAGWSAFSVPHELT